VAQTVLLGWEPERAILEEMLAAVATGQSRALVVHGATGVGKSALLEYAQEAATDMHVLRTAAGSAGAPSRAAACRAGDGVRDSGRGRHPNGSW
jgi:ABC-type nitrate/sulfonate/bicarbonate transport system ATPase subunit